MKNSLLSLLLLLLLLLELIVVVVVVVIIIIIISYLCWFTYCCTMFSISSRFRLVNSSNVTSADVVGMSASVTTSLTAVLICGFCFLLVQLCSRHSKYKSCICAYIRLSFCTESYASYKQNGYYNADVSFYLAAVTTVVREAVRTQSPVTRVTIWQPLASAAETCHHRCHNSTTVAAYTCIQTTRENVVNI